MLPKDLSAIVLLQLAILNGIPGASEWLGIVVVVVLGSVIYTTINSVWVMRSLQPGLKPKLLNYEKLPIRFPAKFRQLAKRQEGQSEGS